VLDDKDEESPKSVVTGRDYGADAEGRKRAEAAEAEATKAHWAERRAAAEKRRQRAAAATAERLQRLKDEENAYWERLEQEEEGQ